MCPGSGRTSVASTRLHRVDDQHVLAVGVDDERERAVVRERDRVRPRHDVAERAVVARVRRVDRQAGELRRRCGVEDRERRERRCSEVERRLRRVGAEHQVRDPELGRARARHGVVDAADLRRAAPRVASLDAGPSATVHVVASASGWVVENADAGPEQVRREERRAVGAPTRAPTACADTARVAVDGEAAAATSTTASSCEHATKTCASSRLTTTPTGSVQTATLPLTDAAADVDRVEAARALAR